MTERNFLATSELAEVADKYGLGTVRSTKSICAGTVNTNHRLSASSGDFFVRVNEDKSESDVEYEAAVVAAMVHRGLPVPEHFDNTRRRAVCHHFWSAGNCDAVDWWTSPYEHYCR